MPITPDLIREGILSNKGLRLETVKHRRIVTNKALLGDNCDGKKTHLMLYVEAHFNSTIEELIWSDTLDNLVKRLEIPKRTLSYWRVKFPQIKVDEVA